jgi:glyoxylase-like metal-dependent hydrolase (beta-lactamase superfamily II)
MDPWTELGDGIHIRQSRAFAMNSAVMVAEGRAVLLDPGVLPSELDDLAAFVQRSGADEITLVFTHDHWDHVIGRQWWPLAETLAHDGFAAAVRANAGRIGEEIARCAAGHGETWTRGFAPFVPDREVSGLYFAPLGPFRMVFRDAPGHAATQLTVHLPDEHLLFAADMLSDIEIPILDGPIAPYRRTIEGLAPLIEGGAIETLVPGHGAIAQGAEVKDRLLRDLLYLDTLEARVTECRAAGLSLEATQISLAEMEYTGKSAAYSMAGVHRDNVRFSFTPARAQQPSAGPPPRAGGAPGPGAPRPRKRRRPHAP